MKENKGKTRKLQRTILISYTVYALVLIVSICATIMVQNLKNKKEQSRDISFSFTKSAAEFLDGDEIEKIVETKSKNEYYKEMESYLQSNIHNTNIVDFYIVVPRENDLLFIVDKARDGNGCKFLETMQYDDFSANAKEYIEDEFNKNPKENVISGIENGQYLATAGTPIFNSDGDPVAIVAVDLVIPNYKSEISGALLTIILIIVFLISLSAFAFFYFERKRLVIPIQTLNDVVKSIVNNLENEEQPEIDIHTGNEIEDLAQSFSKMYGEVHDYINKLSSVTAEKERIGAELDVASKIQASMLPCIFPAFPEKSEFDIYATMDPAKEVGGDFYDFFMVDDENLAVVVADVSGKGVPAALFMVIGKTLIKDHTAFHNDLGEVFTEVNNILCASNSEEMFITAFEGVLNIKTGEFRYVNAGHETPFICKKDGKYEPFKMKPGFVLAGMEGIKYKGGSVILEPGDKLFQYTDGVPEANDKDRQLYGMDRLQEVLVKNSDKSPSELLSSVKTDINDFVGDAPQFDDITMLCLKYKGGK